MSRRKFSPIVQTSFVQFAVLGVGFFNSIILARLLGPTGRGELAAALLWPQALAYLGSFGIQDACVYFAARPRMQAGVILSNAFFLLLVQSALLIPIGYALLPILLAQQSIEVVAVSRFLLVLIFLGLFTLYGTSVIRARLDMGLYNALNLIVPVGSLVGIIGLAVASRLRLPSISLVYVTSYSVVAVATLVSILVRRWWDRFRIDFAVMKKMLSYGARVQLGSVSQIANLRLDQMLMAALMPPAQLGLYVAGVSVASVATVVPSAIRTVLAPRLAQGEDTTQNIPVLQRRLRLYWSVNVAVGIMLMAATPFVITIAFGSDFRPAILAAEILVIASICLGGKDILAGTAYGLGTPILVSQAEVVSLIVTVAMLAALLPLWGIVGAAVASLLAYAAALAFLALRMLKVHHISPRAVLLLDWGDAGRLVSRAQGIFVGWYRR